MGLHLQQSLKQQQQLVLTQSMQQAIKLLQLSQQELVAEVERELAENPALEEAPAHEPGEEGMSEALRSAAESLARDVSEQQNAGPDGDGRGEVDWEKVIEQLDQAPSERGAGASGPDMDDLPTIDQTLTAPPSLAEELLSQLGLQHCTDAERRAAVVIIQNIDERGYLVGLDRRTSRARPRRSSTTRRAPTTSSCTWTRRAAGRAAWRSASPSRRVSLFPKTPSSTSSSAFT